MLTKKELCIHPHPLIYAYNLQKRMQALKADLEGMEIEYNQILLHCGETNLTKQDGFVISVKQSVRRTINPVLFAMEFPDENEFLVKKQAAFMGTELDRLVITRVLRNIRVEDAKELVGNTVLDKACTISITEKISIVKEDTV